MKFPDNWPDDCPPADAEAANGNYFRVGKNNPPVADDFKSHAERGIAPSANPCMRAGLSLLRSTDDATHQTNLFPKLGKLIFCGSLSAEHGKTKLTGGKLPTHTTWWPYEGIDRVAPFVCVGAQ